MHIELLWKSLFALPALLFPGLFGQHTNAPAPKPANVTMSSPAPTAAPKLVRRATPTPAATAKPVAAPKATTTPQAVVAKPAPAATTAQAEIASEQTCPGQADVSKTQAVLACMTAQARIFHGLSAVNANSALMASAGAKAQDMLSCGYGHTACGRTFDYWMSQKGYTGKCTAENIAMGQKTPREVFVAWMNSAGHRANILNASYRHIGVAELGSSKGPLWVMQLGGC